MSEYKMGTTLDALVSGHTEAQRELAELRKAHERYETVRLFTPANLAEAYRVNMTAGTPFDEIVDNATSRLKRGLGI